jgi:hypothetical protein
MVNILFLASSPLDQAKLRLDIEAREIQESLRFAKHRDNFQLQQHGAVRTRDIQRVLLDNDPNIVHFCGHGNGENGLAFEDEQGNTKLVSTESLTNLFKLFTETIECVVLNACYSEVQAEAIAQHISHVIGMKKGISDTAAIKFSTGFYGALGAGRSVKDAYKFGCHAIQIESIPEHLIPVLKINSTGNDEKKFGTSITQPNRLALLKLLNALPPQQLDILLIVLNTPAIVIPPISAAQGDRTAALFRWAEGAGGCGLIVLQDVVNKILNTLDNHSM